MSNKFNSDTISDNQGVAIGKVGSYVKNFKDIDAGRSPSEPIRSSNKPTGKKPSSSSVSLAKLPKELTPETESEIFNHFYSRFGDGTLQDFDSIAGKIASSINRLYNKAFSIEESLKKLNQLIKLSDSLLDSGSYKSDQDELEVETPPVKQTKNLNKKCNVSLKESSYEYIRGLNPLNEEQLELINFINPSYLCFSSDELGHNFFLSIKKEYSKCFDELFDFNPKEQMLFEMFRDQLGNEHNARKLVLMSRVLSSQEEPTKQSKKKSK